MGWSSPPVIEAGTVDATITGPVSLAAGTAVEITGTPSVQVASGSIDIANTPAVTISGTPAVTVNSGTVDATVTGDVSISGTPTVDVNTLPDVTVSNDVTVTPSGTIEVQGVAGGTAIGIAGTVEIATGQSIEISGTPIVEIAAGQSISITGTPTVDATVTGDVSISGTPTVDVNTLPDVTVSNDVTVTPSGTIEVQGVAGGTAIGIAGTVEIVTGQSIEISGTPIVEIAAGQSISITGTPTVDATVTGSVDITSGAVDITGPVDIGSIASGNTIANQAELLYSTTLSSGSSATATVTVPAWAQALLISYGSGGCGAVTTAVGQTSNISYLNNPAVGTSPSQVLSYFQPMTVCPVFPTLDSQVKVTLTELSGGSLGLQGPFTITAIGHLPDPGSLPRPPWQTVSVDTSTATGSFPLTIFAPTAGVADVYEIRELHLSLAPAASTACSAYFTWTPSGTSTITWPRLNSLSNTSPVPVNTDAHPEGVITAPGSSMTVAASAASQLVVASATFREIA